MWSRLRSIERQRIQQWVGSVVLVLNEMVLERQRIQQWVGSVVLVLNEMVLVLVIDAVGPSTSTKIPVNMRNGTTT